jgi:xanthine dehydrogenase accessory factor
MTTMTPDLRTTAEQLRSDRRAFVAATVVRAERPTSAKAGDTALVLDDGTLVGFVGGECAETSVRTQALATLESGEPVLLRIMPDAPDSDVVVESGSVTVHNPCLSGGLLEIFLEPEVPPRLVIVYGDAPIARAVRELSAWMGFDSPAGSGDSAAMADADAVVVASHGGDEVAVLRAALDAGAPYVGLVASPKRGRAVLDAMGLSDEERSRISTPAGLDIGARAPEEVALSILAEIVTCLPPVSVGHHEPPAGADAADLHRAAPTAVDPVCGMDVPTVESSRHLDHDGVRYWFCGSGCEHAFRADPSAFVRP